jgi:hypothetical protein
VSFTDVQNVRDSNHIAALLQLARTLALELNVAMLDDVRGPSHHPQPHAMATTCTATTSCLSDMIQLNWSRSIASGIGTMDPYGESTSRDALERQLCVPNAAQYASSIILHNTTTTRVADRFGVVIGFLA